MWRPTRDSSTRTHWRVISEIPSAPPMSGVSTTTRSTRRSLTRTASCDESTNPDSAGDNGVVLVDERRRGAWPAVTRCDEGPTTIAHFTGRLQVPENGSDPGGDRFTGVVHPEARPAG